MLEPSPLLLVAYVLVPALIMALLLYVVVRFGVKYGMRAYYAEEGRRPRD